MKNFKTFGGCSTALLAAFILTPPAFAQTTEDAPTEQPGRIITDPTPTTGTTTGSHIPVTSDGSAPADIITIGGENSGDVDTRATVERYFTPDTTRGMAGVPTHTYDEDGRRGPMMARDVIAVTVGNVVTFYEVVLATPTSPSMRGAIIDTFEEIDKSPNYRLTKITGGGTNSATTHTAINPRSIAIGAESLVRGDQSVAIGDNAQVIRVQETPAIPVTTYMLDEQDGTGSQVVQVDGVFVDGVDLRTVYEQNPDGTRGDEIGLYTAVEANDAYIFEKDTDPGEPEIERINVDRSVAVGAGSEVEWDNSVAIGAGATVATEGEVAGGDSFTLTAIAGTGTPTPGTATHMYDPDGDTGPLPARSVEIFANNVYEVTSDGTRGQLISSVADILSPTLGARNGVAIGADARVTGEGGIAIGGGVSDGVDVNGNGDYTDAGDTPRTTVTAGANEIAIGGDNHDGAINIGNVDLRYEQGRITTNETGIATNVESILNNGANIKVNRDNIATNASDIATNTKGIATAVAIAGLATGPGSGLSVGFGSFQSETSIAIGYDNTFGAEQNMTFKAAAASAGSGSTAGSLSMRWAF